MENYPACVARLRLCFNGMRGTTDLRIDDVFCL
jgi:hypothetical protein